MNSSVSPEFRVVRLIAGLILIIIGAGLFLMLTSSINVAGYYGSPMSFGFFSSYTQYFLVILVLDLLFLSLILGGVKLAGFGWTVFAWIIVVLGIGVLCLGIWNHIDGPPIDYDSSRSDERRMPVQPELNGAVYIWAGLTMLVGLLLVALTSRARRTN